MQHQSPQVFNIPPSQPTTNITTEQIQKYLDENKQLILAIMESQNLGKLNDCAQYQAQLQKNLMYLAAIADAQPQAPTGPSQPQMPAQSPVPQGPFMQPAQPAVTQQLMGAPRLPFILQSFDQQSPRAQHQPLAHAQHQQLAGVMGSNNGLHPGIQTGFGAATLMDSRSRRDASGGGSGDGQGK